MKNSTTNAVTIIGAGHFGIVLADIISRKTPVIVYSRTQKKIDDILKQKSYLGLHINDNITFSNDLTYVITSVKVIFIVVPSKGFKDTIKNISQYLSPYHIIIHATKGLDIDAPSGQPIETAKKIQRRQVRTMSELVTEYSIVSKVGCISGPNLSKEIAQGLPAATVLASHFDSVIDVGKSLLNCERLRVFYSHDLIGIEFCGVLKNIIALSAGTLHGLSLGNNALGFLISRGLIEMIELGERFGGKLKSFIGLAGIGDLVATSMSTQSRNYQFGYQLTQGNDVKTLIDKLTEPVEGLNSVLIMKKLVDFYRIKAPILETIYKVIYEGMSPKQAVKSLLKIPQTHDVSDNLSI